MALTDLNAALEADGYPYRLGVARPEALKPAPKNARFMTQETFAQLVANVARDGNLASLPFCWREGDSYHILSGHHRVDAAREAGVSYVLFLYTDAELTQSERVAIQLSHNAIAGEDSLAALKELYEQIESVELQQYSGLDDVTVGRFEEVAPATFQDAHLDFEEVYLLFTPSEVDRVRDTLERLRAYPGATVLAADRRDWEAFWETLLGFKEARNIVNTATAISAMIEIVTEWLAGQEAVTEE
jgi:hypothetical protein